MAIQSLICPQCGASFEIDDSLVFGFCNFCGNKIQISELIHIKHSGTVEVDGIDGYSRLLERGNALLATEQFDKAEVVFDELLERYPDIPEGYERCVAAKSRNYDESLPDELIVRIDIPTYVERMRTVCSKEKRENIELLISNMETYDEGPRERIKLKIEKSSLQRKFDGAKRDYAEAIIKANKMELFIKGTIVTFAISVIVLAAGLIQHAVHKGAYVNSELLMVLGGVFLVTSGVAFFIFLNDLEQYEEIRDNYKEQYEKLKEQLEEL